MKQRLAAAVTLMLLAGCGLQVPMSGLAGGSAVTLTAQDAASSILPGTLLVNGQSGASIPLGAPISLAWQLHDPGTGQALTQFGTDDGKVMHLIIVRSDLSTYAHVHPTLAPDGTFNLQLDAPTSDPDNQDAVNAIPEPGSYFLIGQVVRAGQTTLSEARATLTAAGNAPVAPVVPDPTQPDGSIVKYFHADGTSGPDGSDYQLTLTQSDAGGMETLNVHIAQRMAMGQRALRNMDPMYMPVTDLQPWLGMTGHMIMISAAGSTVDQKVFRHIHAGMGDMAAAPDTAMPMPMPSGSTGPDLNFMLMGSSSVPHGVYKVWCQTKHDDRVFAFPFVVTL